MNLLTTWLEVITRQRNLINLLMAHNVALETEIKQLLDRLEQVEEMPKEGE